ncbi:hypothetical protein DASC09_010670 [Saccharomycopsis crataegensis]|uniref:RRM domain-containing protein n=1 Tax=Saccharomycopsis crataegensis TaxID=43959 RepID=A0AAV5QGI9_9ASCO|nr:hypothetical protein DASC09_010670 [Saccharomycopsis crataegensis]
MSEQMDELMDIEPLGQIGDANEINTTPSTSSDTHGVRHEAMFLRFTLDALSTHDIKRYLDHHLKDAVASVDQRINRFTIEWINDTSICVVFDDAESCSKALAMLTNDYDDVTRFDSTTERKAKTYFFGEQPKETGEEQKQQNEIYIREAYQTDKKEKNAKDKSRYYLLYGEPERSRRPRQGTSRRNYSKNNYRERDTYVPGRSSRGGDGRGQSDEDDLFAGKFPSLSSGGSAINEAFNHNNARDDRMDQDDTDIQNRWKSDKFNGHNDADDDDLFPSHRPRRRSRSRSPSGYHSSRSRSPVARDLKDRIAPNNASHGPRRRRAHNLFD